MTLQCRISRELGIVTVYPANLPPGWDREAFGVDLTEADLILMLSDLQGVDAYTPTPRTAEL